MDKSLLKGRPEDSWASGFSHTTLMERLRHQPARWIFGVFMVFYILSAARIGVADLLSRQVRDEMYAWSAATTQPDEAAITDVAGQLALARMLSPDNPDHYEDLANLALIRASRLDFNNHARSVQLTDGLALIRKAIALRPASSHGWAILLLLKRERAEFDAEFRQALARAITLGPWEPGIQQIVADVGMSAWAVLPLAEQEIVRENFVRGMKRQAKMMTAIVQMHRNDCSSPRAELNAGCPR